MGRDTIRGLDVTGSDLLTVALLVALEGLLSADNALVLAVLVLGLPRHEQRKALRYGIVGAFAFRVVSSITGASRPSVATSSSVGRAPAASVTSRSST